MKKVVLDNRIEENEKKRFTSGTSSKLSEWKMRRRKHRVYFYMLLIILTLSLSALGGSLLYVLDGYIPSDIYISDTGKRSFDFNIPATAEIVTVGVTGKSNISPESIVVDLKQEVTVPRGQSNLYNMAVKLFGIFPFKQVNIHVVEERKLIPMGIPVGIYMKTDGIMVIGEGEIKTKEGILYRPAHNILQSGDYIKMLNGDVVDSKEEFIEKIENSNGAEQILFIERDGKMLTTFINPVLDQNGKYKIGVWIRDNVQGVGTLTFIDEAGRFGALGHSINDVDTKDVVKTKDGTLYETEIVRVKKGERGTPGEMTGLIVYDDEKIWGDIWENKRSGIFGCCNNKMLSCFRKEPMIIGYKQEIELGPAQILCTIDDTAKYYDVEITDIHLEHDNINRGIELQITDPELLKSTGGIVQGMSGAPIIQNNKFIGAVTHVLVNNPKKGYGIFIENMLEEQMN